MKSRLMGRPLRRVMGVLGAVSAAVALMVSCASPGEASLEVSDGVVIRNVTVVDTRDGARRPGRAVVVKGNKIQRIVADASVRISGSATAVDGSGQFIVPGYLDMHTHAIPMAEQQPSIWPLLLAHGVTGIREMAGSPALMQRAAQLNAESAAGRLDAPEIVQIPGDLVIGLPTAAAGTALVRQQKAQGVQFIKVVVASRDATLALLQEAKTVGLPVAGHLPLGVPAVEAANAGWAAVEHLGAGLGLLLDCSSEEAAVRGALLRGEGAKPNPSPLAIISPMLFRAADAPFYQRVADSQDAAKCEGVVRSMAAAGTWQVPTLVRLRSAMYSGDASYRSDPRLEMVDRTRRALWEQVGTQYATTMPPAADATFKSYYNRLAGLMPLLKRQGTKLLTGSDLGGIWMLPGASLHDEFIELQRAGLAPLDVLQATTLRPAQFLGREASMGTVDEGKKADLVLLEADPVADAANLTRITGVFVNGKYFGKPALARMKQAAVASNEQQPLRNIATALDPHHRH